MYINQIDELIDKLIDEFYLTSIADNKNLDKILGEPDYVKFQKEINEMMINFSKRINITEIRTLVKSIDAAYQIEQTIKRYIAYYIFLLIGFHYTDREELFINNIVEFTKNQYNYNFKIEKFFNSESNALLLKYKTIMQYILIKLGTDQTKVDRIRNRKEYKETIAFLNSLPSMEYITSKFMIQNTNNIQAHNIIKTLIIVLMYGANDKRDFFKLLELSEITEGEYTFIDIVVPTKKTVDFTLIENILSKSPHGKTNAYNFWRFFTDREDEISLPPLSHDEKILKLINSGIVVPIVDDFILYHKDVEKYDKVTDPNKTKKKEDTKIKYIINKIDNIKEYYSEQIVVDEKIRSEIKKLFYVPLLNRKAVLVNMKEDINIINKFINIGKQNVENIDYLKDLEQYNTYPYVNFSEFEKSGFSLTLSKTINTIRSVSLAKSGDFRQTISYNIIQTRTGSKDMTINIVGFAVPSTITPLPCIKIKNVFDVKTLDPNNKNGYQLILKYLRDTFMNLNQHNKTIAWLFDEDTDAIEQSEYEQLSKFSMVDRTKSIASNLYDKIYEELQTIMINIFNEGKDTITIQDGYDIIDQLERNLLPISHDRKLYPDIEYALFNSIQTLIPEYDKNDDIVYNFESLFGSENKKTETLKNLKGIEKPPIPVYRVNLSAINEYGNIDVKEKVSGICQHTITFDTISAIGKKDYVKMSEELHRFIQKYVTLNMYDDHVCKSCGSNLDIKKYIEDGEYDDDSRTFVSYATPININLTDVVGYEKYRESIKNIDKIIEKVATVSNILHLTKGSVNVKSKRKLIVKSTIDLILNNYKRLKKISKERKIASAKSYGINENLSNLFVFELTDEIFKFSSKDIDKLKPLKQNNAICYSIFMTILEINNTHVLFMKNDKKKMCNFNNFEKIIDALFGNLRIIINNRGEIAPIINYKILCYMIYVISCAVVSYTKLWYYDGENSKKNIGTIQRSLIHTLVDIINSILEISNEEQNKNPLYNMIAVRFYKKIQDVFKDMEIYNMLKKNSADTHGNHKINSILTDNEYTTLSGSYVPHEFEEPSWRSCRSATLKIKTIVPLPPPNRSINNITNCPDGKYHVWASNNKLLTCKLCGANADNITYDPTLSGDIQKKFRYFADQEIAINICATDGQKHTYTTTPENPDTETCSKCHKPIDYEYSDKELTTINEILFKINENKRNEAIAAEKKIANSITTEKNYTQTVITKLKTDYTDNIKLDILHKLSDEIQQTIGNEINDINLIDNVYIIDHDHLGNTIEPLKISETQRKINHKQSHPFFNTDVLYYTNLKYGKIEIFYDAYSKILIGYKEENKPYVIHKNHDRKIKLNYSLLNKIKLLGYKSMFIDTSPLFNTIINTRFPTYKRPDGSINIPNAEDRKIIANEIIDSIIRNRAVQLKKMLFYLKIVLSCIINNSTDDATTNEDYYRKKINTLIDKYRKKSLNPVLSDPKGNNGILKHWNAIYTNLLVEENIDAKIDFDPEKHRTIYFEDITKIDTTGNTLTYYFINELLKFFTYNPNKAIKTLISNFIVDFINLMFDIVNEEKENDNIEIKRFKYQISGVGYISEIEEKSSAKNLEGIYSEYVDSEDKTQQQIEEEHEEMLELQEERDAMDVDVDADPDNMPTGDDINEFYNLEA